MSSSPTAPISTTVSSSDCSFLNNNCAPPGQVSPPAGQGTAVSGGRASRETGRTAVIACGALGGHLREIIARRGWPVSVHNLPAIWHNDPRRIAPAAAELASALLSGGSRVVLAYADCGTYGELDKVCERLGIARLPGLHCYDVLGGAGRIARLLAQEPGTYLLTDYLVRGFRRCVLEPLGLVSHPGLWPDYFGHYRRLVWLAQDPEPGLAAQADAVAGLFGLPLTVIETGTRRLERELERMLHADPAATAGRTAPQGSAAPALGPRPEPAGRP